MKKFFVLYSLKQKLTPTLYKTKLTVTKHASTNQSLKFEEFDSQDQAKRFIQKLVTVTSNLSQKQERRTSLTEKQVKQIFQSIIQDTKTNIIKDNQLIKEKGLVKNKAHDLAVSHKSNSSLTLNKKTNNWALQSINHGMLIKGQTQTKDSSYSISGKEGENLRAQEQGSTQAQTNYTQTHTTEESSFKEKRSSKKFAHWVLWNKNDLTQTIKLGRKKEELLKTLNELEKQHSAQWVKENITIEDYRLKKQASTAYDNLLQKRKQLLDQKRAQMFSQVSKDPQQQKSGDQSYQMSQPVNQASIESPKNQIQEPYNQEGISPSLNKNTQQSESSKVLTSEQKKENGPSESFLEDQEHVSSIKWQDEKNDLEPSEIQRRNSKVVEQSKVVIDWDQVKEINYVQSIASENIAKISPKTKQGQRKSAVLQDDSVFIQSSRYHSTLISYEQIFTTPLEKVQSHQQKSQKIENEPLKQNLALLRQESQPEIQQKAREPSKEGFESQTVQKSQLKLSQTSYPTSQPEIPVQQTPNQPEEQFLKQEPPKKQLLKEKLHEQQAPKNQLNSQQLQKQEVSQSIETQTLKQEKVVQQYSLRMNQEQQISEEKDTLQQKVTQKQPHQKPFLHPFNMNYIHQHILKLSQSQKTVQSSVSSLNRSLSLNPSIINAQNPGLSIAQFTLQQEQTQPCIRPKQSYKLFLGKRKRQSAQILSLAYTLAMINSLGTGNQKVRIKLNRQTQKVLNYNHKLDQEVIEAKKFLSTVEQNVKGKYEYVL